MDNAAFDLRGDASLGAFAGDAIGQESGFSGKYDCKSDGVEDFEHERSREGPNIHTSSRTQGGHRSQLYAVLSKECDDTSSSAAHATAANQYLGENRIEPSNKSSILALTGHKNGASSRPLSKNKEMAVGLICGALNVFSAIIAVVEIFQTGFKPRGKTNTR